MEQLEIISKEMFENKEELIVNVQKIFTRLRSALNERED